MAEINGERLLQSLQTLRGFGAVGTGVVRPTFSDIDIEARRWLRDQMETAGLDATIDGVANVFGRSRSSGPALVLGSHSDTQPEGGWLDGALGVMYAIEVARALGDDQETSHLAVDAASWADEEGTYSGFLGARSFVGDLADVDFTDTNADGETVAAALTRLGLTDVPRVGFEPDRHVGYLEAHIEQGPHLEDSSMRIGVVTSIVGIRAMQITFTGEQNHAGTTAMARRKDAGVAMFEFGSRIQKRLAALADPATVWTIGNARLSPGAESIVPGSAWCGIQFRDPSDEVLDRFESAIVDLAGEMTVEGPVSVVAELRRDRVSPSHMDSGLRRHLTLVAEQRVTGEWVEMPSAAGHDPMVMTHRLPCAMLFIPSIGGISHDFAEDTSDADIVTGCQVLADAVVSILSN